MNKINKIKSQIESIRAESLKAVSDLESKAQLIFNKLMDSHNETINAMVSQVESSRDIVQSEFDSVDSWARVDFKALGLDLKDDFIKDLLRTYLSETHNVFADFDNDCLTMSQGPCILINHEGDVLDQDSGKWIISRQDYETVSERDEMIERYMDQTDHYPSVVKSDYHGNLSYYDTKKAA